MSNSTRPSSSRKLSDVPPALLYIQSLRDPRPGLASPSPSAPPPPTPAGARTCTPATRSSSRSSPALTSWSWPGWRSGRHARRGQSGREQKSALQSVRSWSGRRASYSVNTNLINQNVPNHPVHLLLGGDRDISHLTWTESRRWARCVSVPLRPLWGPAESLSLESWSNNSPDISPSTDQQRLVSGSSQGQVKNNKIITI